MSAENKCGAYVTSPIALNRASGERDYMASLNCRNEAECSVQDKMFCAPAATFKERFKNFSEKRINQECEIREREVPQDLAPGVFKQIDQYKIDTSPPITTPDKKILGVRYPRFKGIRKSA